MNNKIVIVTGCSAGIGKETARDLLSKGAKVIFACRNKNKTLNVIDDITTQTTKPNAIFMQLDLTSFNSVNAFVQEFSKKFDRLDLLINNAGLINDTFILTEDGLENTLQSNHVSHFALTGLLLKFLKNSEDPRVINVSSEAHKYVDDSLTKPLTASSYKAMKMYGITKAANVLYSESLKEFSESRQDELSKLKNASAHPGVVRTEFLRYEGRSFFSKVLIFIFTPILMLLSKDENMGAQTTLHCSYIARNDLKSGAYFKDCKEAKKDVVIRKFDLEKILHRLSYEAVVKSVLYTENQQDKYFMDYLDFYKTKF